MSDVQFINGLMFKPPVKKDGSALPHFIKAKGSIKRAELIETLQAMDGEYVNFDVKEAKSGKWYAAVNTWEPTKDQEYKEGVAQARQVAEPRAQAPAERGQPAFDDFSGDIPFAQHERGML